MSGLGTTPGPWVAEPADYFGDHNIIRGNSYETLAIGAVVSNMRPAEVVAANANLIAAAPELYEALEDLLSQVVQGHMAHNFAQSPSTQEAVRKANSALSRARCEVAK